MANTIHFQLRGDTAENWERVNPVLFRNEPGFDMTNNRLKMGDGVTAWNDLVYVAPNVVDNFLTGGAMNALSAEQGKILNESKIEKDDMTNEIWLFTLENGTVIGKKVALWNS